MGHIIKISMDKNWFAANWAAEHLVRLIIQFLPPQASASMRQRLEGIGTVTWDLDFSDSSPSDIRYLLDGAQRAFDALTKAGPGTEFFADADFYPGFVDRFREFIDTLRRDERVAHHAA